MAKDPKSTTETESTALPPEDYKRAQETGAKDPVSQTVDPGEIETMDDLGIGPRDPYPTGNPPEPIEGAPTDRAPRFKDKADREKAERAQTAPPVRSSRT